LLGKLGRQVLEWERNVGRPRMVTWQAGHWACRASRAVTQCTGRTSSQVGSTGRFWSRRGLQEGPGR
jgi:hypothetical protein